ncbi:interleukin-12 subunit alpha [Archocentrus centrarchus]|uniref:interleukin-12 subunit alpha n=1 Tax=Archocentrus centrarchus TaxID=63155 RepID=UPI0011E9DB6B|nr:interleukin-12 subunit alpha-like [Archocentrus centrarchus]
MANIQFYLASCALLLLTLNWRTSTGLPVPAPSPGTDDQCSDLYRRLLLNISNALSSGTLSYGIPSEKVEVRGAGETVLACAPTQTQNSNCMMQRNFSFSESECLKNIMKDLAYYGDAIQSYLEHPLKSPNKEAELLNPIVEIIQSLTKNCFPQQNGENQSTKEDAKVWGNDSFTNRLEMYKMMRGFHIRAITINRAIGYIASGDHRK